MPKPSRGRGSEREVPREELEAIVLEALAGGAGIKRSGLKKALPKPYKAANERALELLRELADRERIHRWSKGTKEVFFARDPIATLETVVVELLREGPLGVNTLKAALKTRAPGHDDLFAEWLKNALGRRVLFEVGPPPGTMGKHYGLEADVRGLLKKEIASLSKAVMRLEALGVARERVADVLLAELGLAERLAGSNGTQGGDAGGRSGQFLAALNDLAAANPRGALLSIRELRSRVALGKDEFDETALQLQEAGTVSLHHHDHPFGLSEAERSGLVHDGRGEHYVGITLRRGT
jgi:hypothetical protein